MPYEDNDRNNRNERDTFAIWLFQKGGNETS